MQDCDNTLPCEGASCIQEKVDACTSLLCDGVLCNEEELLLVCYVLFTSICFGPTSPLSLY